MAAISLSAGVIGAGEALAAPGVPPQPVEVTDTAAGVEPVALDTGSAAPFTASADPKSGSAALPGLLLRCLNNGSSTSGYGGLGLPHC
ncbi:hypothetical protein [Nocardia huaxiensis]|uniref:hypothetical protein n=1 Tax=Nocardia huaxiensis TaxID=2755382 RepID=UPI001E5A1D27|nr:hypothetical protein [Nocardia huaxiensis]UFS97493.1 hypothetical protein LPY97_06185 [Nocardia huaxiensis]